MQSNTSDSRWPRWLGRLFTRPANQASQIQDEEPIPTDYGHGYEAKEMVNGQWVLWHNGQACDLKHYGYAWNPATRFFRDCIGTRKQIDTAAKEIMSVRGVFKQST